MADLARIKNNVAKMVAQNAPESDIDGYIASEGVTVDDVRAFKAQPAPNQYESSFLPFVKDANGNVQFDSNVGLLGSIKRSFMLPGDAMAGKVDPMSEEGIGRSLEFAGTFSPGTPGLRSGDRLIPGAGNTLTRAKVEPPTADALRTAAKDGYDALKGLKVDYKSAAVQSLANKMKSDLESDGIISELAPKTFAIVKKLQDAPENSVAPIAGLEAARRTFANAAKDFSNPTEQLAAKRAMEALDQFIARPDPAATQMGSATKAAEIISDARGNYAAAKRSGRISGIGDDAELAAAAANSGQNIGNATRQRVKSVLLSPKQRAGYSPEEVAALEGVVKGSPLANTTRYAGNLLGGGGGLGASVAGAVAGTGSAVATGNPYMAAAGLAAPILGAVSKKVSNGITERAMQNADELVRMRSPLYRQMLDNAPMTLSPESKTAAMMRYEALVELNRQKQADALEKRKRLNDELKARSKSRNSPVI